MSTDALNVAVTGAIMKAEDALRNAIACWREVEKCEVALVKHHAWPVAACLVAEAGAGSARVTVAVLEALYNGRSHDERPCTAERERSEREERGVR